ncbi:glycine-rich domain-containing protein [Serratia fonticola]
MQSSSFPKKLSIPFANSGDKQDIPNTSQIGVEDGRASYPDGFPPLTRTHLSAGGRPPFGTDMNGVLFDVTDNARWNAAGASYKYDALFSSDIGGYPKGAILSNSSSDGFWQSIVENNTSNPDAGGAGWINASSGRLIRIKPFYSSGVYTPSPGTKFIVTKVQGGGGAGGGSAATSAGRVSVGGGGTAGAYAESVITTGFSSVNVTVGAGGSPVSGGAGGNGGTSSFGSIISCPGGTGGPSSGAVSPPYIVCGGLSVGPTGSAYIAIPGSSGSASIAMAVNGGFGAPGGNSMLGSGGGSVFQGFGGVQAGGFGAGGGGTMQLESAGAISGGGGASGIVIVYEYS